MSAFDEKSFCHVRNKLIKYLPSVENNNSAEWKHCIATLFMLMFSMACYQGIFETERINFAFCFSCDYCQNHYLQITLLFHLMKNQNFSFFRDKAKFHNLNFLQDTNLGFHPLFSVGFKGKDFSR